MTTWFNLFDETMISREARRDAEATLRAIIRFADGDWGTCGAAIANDEHVSRQSGDVHGIYGNIAVSGTLGLDRGELVTTKLLVRTAEEIRISPLPFQPACALS